MTIMIEILLLIVAMLRPDLPGKQIEEDAGHQSKSIPVRSMFAVPCCLLLSWRRNGTYSSQVIGFAVCCASQVIVDVRPSDGESKHARFVQNAFWGVVTNPNG